ncbi:WD40-repeat-containing domain protein [Clohesyomyces aquaticus]|uniref:WD40-repeat-containing domain protein n=1 Tax=Clohesyomyces aquaticus TaxID=1231657 RepID=A0A1Y1Z0K7_9PLEO|nr:WD40-repeat-containing domain protein [Clohesyomyces aquaticus]
MADHLHSELPSFRSTIKLGGKDEVVSDTWWDIKFYPYDEPGAAPVFAVTGLRHTLICRCVSEKDTNIEVLRWFEDDNKEAELYSVAWSRAANGDPLICVAGADPIIKVLNVRTKETFTALAGHGDVVNDLAVSPADPTIIASASKDSAVRIWTLNPDHGKQPTAAICHGEGHRENVLSLGFHRNGQYLLSGGADIIFNLWTVPKFRKEDLGTDKPSLIHFPHFSSTEIHNHYIECVKFYGDLIMSHASQEDHILLWRIDNFDASKPPPGPAPMPHYPVKFVKSADKATEPEKIPKTFPTYTRSAWGGNFQRLMRFHRPKDTWYHSRFSIFHAPGMHPILAGPLNSKVYFWDLQELENACATEEEAEQQKKNAKKVAVPNRMRDGSAHSAGSSSSAPTSTTVVIEPAAKSSTKKGKRSDRTTAIGDPFRKIMPHNEGGPKNYKFSVRQIAWSTGGDWCVACGQNGVVALYSRWEDGIPQPQERGYKRLRIL